MLRVVVFALQDIGMAERVTTKASTARVNPCSQSIWQRPSHTNPSSVLLDDRVLYGLRLVKYDSIINLYFTGLIFYYVS